MIVLGMAAALIGAFAAIFVLAPIRGAGIPKWAGPVGAACLLLITGGVYWIGGSPNQAGAPYQQAAAERRESDPAELEPAARIERLRDILRENDTDAEAWGLLGRELARSEQEIEAIRAFQRALTLDPQARTFSDLGQTLINLNEGEVTADARSAFEAALARNPDLPEAGFFLGLGAYQDGDRARAVQHWTAVLARLEAGNPFREIIARQAADLLSRPDVDSIAVTAAQQDGDMEVTPQERIAGMVARLSDRVARGEGSLSDYLVLMRVRAMMGETELAREAVESARTRFAGDEGALAIVSVADAALAARGGEN
ncbi:MAG: hypothetical protein CMF74_08255 [Maricaulis sp.]|jgi:cytochrome c-type biogenesis protein CcmH|nr:hypothetical protein [Maricaulis sp.]HAQ35447.1 hypothetical protein [Alphaproteobacteria bacterium]